MMRRILANGIFAGIAVISILIILGSLLGQPILIGYVESDSMSPTIKTGDGFLAIPSALDSEIQEGDVVVFRPEEINGGELTTHRVVERTTEGFVTQGDGNAFTDQDGIEPPVKRTQVVATVVQAGGEVVTVPFIGTIAETLSGGIEAVQRRIAILLGTRALLGAQGLGYLLFAGAVVFYGVDWYREGATRERAKRITRRDTGVSMRLVLVGFAALLVVGATAAMVAPSGTTEYGVVSAEFESERPDVIPAGESKSHAYQVPNGGLLAQQVYVEPASESVAVSQQRLHVAGGATARTAVTLSAPPETGYYRRYVVEHRYLAVLPGGVIDALYEFHPWAPIVAIDAPLAGGFLALTLPFAPGGRIRKRTRDTGGLVGAVTRRFKRFVG
jgi:signal peptidase